MKREEALKLLRQIEAYRKTPAMDNAERDITCRIIVAMVAEACKKFKNATSPLIRWMIRDELAAKVTELYRRPVF